MFQHGSFQRGRTAIAAIAVALVALTGCKARAEFGVGINEDGSGEVSYAMGLDEGARRFLAERGADPDKEMERALGQVGDPAFPGTREEEWAAAGFRGRRFITEFTDLDELEDFWNAPGETPILEATREGDVLTLEVDIATFGRYITDGFTPPADNEEFELRFTVRVPGRVLDHNADAAAGGGGGELAWDLLEPHTETARVRVDLHPGSSSGSSRLLLVGSAVAGAGWLVSRRFRAQAQELPPAGAKLSMH